MSYFSKLFLTLSINFHGHEAKTPRILEESFKLAQHMGERLKSLSEVKVSDIMVFIYMDPECASDADTNFHSSVMLVESLPDDNHGLLYGKFDLNLEMATGTTMNYFQNGHFSV